MAINDDCTLEEVYKEIVEKSGGIFRGIQKGYTYRERRVPDLVLVDDAFHSGRSTLAIPIRELTVEHVQQRLQDQRFAYARAAGSRAAARRLLHGAANNGGGA